MSSYQDVSLYEKVLSLDEKNFQYLAVNFFREAKYLTFLTHGPLEHGADALMLFEPRDDFFGRGQLIFLQMKKGNTTLAEWHQKLCGQLTELFCRPPERPNVDIYLSRRIILLTSGVPQQGVLKAINNWNQKLPLPIELVDGLQFTRMLIERGYNMTNVDKLIKKPDEVS